MNSITSLFKDGTISFNKGNVNIKSPVAGNRTGTYTLKNGIIDMEFGENSQVSLHIKNDGENLAILFSEDGENETGKIILAKIKMKAMATMLYMKYCRHALCMLVFNF